MLFRLLTLFSVLILLSACESDGTGTSAEGEDGVSGSEDGGITSSDISGDIQPGSQEELVAAIGDRVFFSFNSATLNDVAQRTLQRQAEWLKQHSDVKVTIEGHCDERGTREYNLALGERRAAAAKKYLVRLGISSSRVSITSYGKEHPEVLGSDEAAWSKNRRAVTVVGQ